MSEVSASFAFPSSFSHSISSGASTKSLILTGGDSGEILIRSHSSGDVLSTLTIQESLKCQSLLTLSPPAELSSLFSTSTVILSLHTRSQLRLWTESGRCIMTSHDLFSSQNELDSLLKLSEFEVAVKGKNEVFIVDAYRMQSVKYLCCDSQIFAFSSFNNEIWTQTQEKLYKFNLQSENDRNQELIIKNRVDPCFSSLLACNSAFVAVSNGKDLQIFKKGKEILMKKVVQDLPLDWICWNLNGLIAVSGNVFKFYRIEEVIKAFYEEKFRILPEVIRLACEKVRVFWSFDRFLCCGCEDQVFEFDIEGKTGRSLKLVHAQGDFPMLNVGEVVVTRNILLGDEVFLALGTDIGRVIIFSLFSELKLVCFHERSPVTFIALHKSCLLAATLSQNLAFWDFCPDPAVKFTNEARKVLEVWTSHLKLIIPLDFVNEKNCENHWESILMGQTETGAILLIDVEAQSIISYFQALKSSIISARLHVHLEYLQVYCENGHIYIFNMISLVLERDIFGDAVFNFHYFDKSAKVDRFSVLLNSVTPHYSKKPLKVSFCFINETFIPVLNVNSIVAQKKCLKIVKDLRKIWENSFLVPAFFAKTREVSFEFKKSSNLYNSVKIVSFYQFYDEILEEPSDFFQLLIMSLHPESKFKRVLFEFSEKDAILKSFIEKSGNLILKNTISGKNLPKIISNKEILSLSEVILLSTSIINSLLHPSRHKSHFLEDTTTLLHCNSNEFSLFTCQLLISGSSSLEFYINDENITSLIESLLSSSCSFKKSSENEYFYQSLISVGLLSVSKFIKTLTNYIKLSEKGKLHHKIFFTIEHFIINHFLQATSVIEEIADFLLGSHELKSSIGSKRFSADFSTVLETLVGLLPMTCHTLDARFLVCGLPTGILLVYDFKSNKKWKPFRLFETTITSVDILELNIVGYSSQESFVKLVKMEPNLFLSGGDLKVTEMIPLHEVEPETNSYQEMIKTTRIRWTSRGSFLLYRENKQEYNIKVNNFQ